MPFAVIITNVVVYLILLVTLQIIIGELCRRPVAVARPRLIVWLGRLRWLFVILIFLAFGSLMPWIYLFSFLAILIPVIVRCIALQSAEQIESLEDVVALVAAKDPAALPDATERFADDQSLTMKVRCRDFAHRLRSGQLPEDAIRQSRIPLGVDAALAMRLGPAAKTQLHASKLDRTNATEASETELAASWVSWPIMSQLSYLIFLICLLIGISTFMSLFILPTISKMLEEFEIQPSVPDSVRTGFGSITSTLLVIMVIWLVMIFLSAVTGSRVLLRITPWFGDWLRSRNRHRGLKAIASGVAMGRPIAEVLELSRRTSPARWIRSRSKLAYKKVIAGQDVALALRSSGWLSRPEAAWVQASIPSGNLAQTLDWIASSIRRRYELKWRVRVAWLAPLMLILIGAMVSLLAYYMFGSLVQIINTLSAV